MQSITSYGGGHGIQTTTISPNGGGGYNYVNWGGLNSGSWGGVTASPGTIVTPAIGPRGGVTPIVSPKPSYLNGINAQEEVALANLAAQNAALLSQPIVVPSGNPKQEYNQGYQDAKNEARHEAYLA